MIELELQCAQNHQKPIICVLFDEKLIKNEKLLCTECMDSYSSNTQFMGFKVALQIIEENQKQKRDFVYNLIDQNYQLLNSFKLILLGLKSSIIQELDSLNDITESWIHNLDKIKSDNGAFSFHEELDKLVLHGKDKVNEISKVMILNQIKELNSQWSTKLHKKLNQFNQFEDCQKCQAILNDLIFQKIKQDNQISAQEPNKNITNIYEGEYQQKKGYVQIDNFIQSVLSDQFMKKIFQGNDKLIELEFKKNWEQYIRETNRASEQQYLEMVDTQYKAIKSISTQYILNTNNELEYFNYFRDVIIKQNPNDLLNKEQEKIFQLFMQEFQETEQFIFIDKNKQNLAYLDIFHQTIQEKLEKSKDQLLDMKSFYSQEIIYQVVAKLDIQSYLDQQFEQDFQQFLRKFENHLNIRTHFFNFISILEYLKISYDKYFKQQLDNIVNNPSFSQHAKEFLTRKGGEAYEAFQDLKLSLKFQNYQEIDLTNTKFIQTFKNTYLNLKITNKTYSSWDNIQQNKKELLQYYIILGTLIEIQSSQNNYQESFNYIKSPQGDIPDFVRQNFPKQLNKIMIEFNGWNKLYDELYNLIKQEIGYSKSKIEFQDENIQSFNPYLITGIMQKVENNIKVKYNNQFAQFGVILTDVGERCIYYYSMLIIWRFFCYQRWNSKNIQQKHQNNYQNELIRCIAEINQDNEKQSCIKATEFVNKIQIAQKNQFLDKTKKEVLQKMNQISMSNFELIAKLDKELLIDVNETKFKDQQFQQQIISYTTDHKSYINKYTQDMLTQFQLELLNEYSNKYRSELSLYLKSIYENAKIVYKYIENQNKEVKTFKYFQEDNNEIDKIFYENQMFRLLMQCLHGKIEDKIDIIEHQYKEIFQISNYNPVNSQFIINWQLLNPQDQQVYNLKNFVKTLIEQIDQLLKNIDQIKFNQSEYQLDVEFGKLKLQMNGCEYTCPCCQRKCDQDNDDSHTHQCQNGHQIRGINGILISKDSPSLFTCEEILDECMIKTLETNLERTWKDVKKIHLSWNFKNLFSERQNENIDKWKNVWNRGLGKLICQHLQKQLKHEVIFSFKSEIETLVSNIHYILILDDSGSMQGNNWDKAKNGALNCIKSLENTDCAKISVIIFNGDARIVAECEKPSYKEMNKKITYKGGGTSFEPPFKLALELIQKYNNFNKIQILFYTDGEAGYPQNIVDQFCQLPQDIKKLINLTACSGEQSSQTLALIVWKFKQNMQSAELRNSVQPMDVQRVWTEVVSQNIHYQLA